MAIGPIVKSILVRMSAEGAAETKRALEEVAADAEALSKLDPTVTVGVDDKGGLLKLRAMRLELRALELKGADQAAFRDIASRFRDIGTSADGARLKTAALGLELRAIQDLAAGDKGGGGGGFWSKILGALGSKALFGSLGGKIGALFGGGGAAGGVAGGVAQGAGGAAGAAGAAGPVGAIGAAGIGASVITLMLTGIGGIIPALAAAGIGVASFGALALPTFSKVAAAITAIGAATNKTRLDRAWDAVPKSLQPVVHGVLDLQSAFGKLALQLQPLVLRIAGVGLQIANKLLPALLPFAKVAGNAILTLLQSFDKFSSSPGFKAFLADMLKLSGPAILAIGQGVGRVAIAVGKLLEALVNPNGIRALKAVFDVIEWVVQGLAAVIRNVTGVAITQFAVIARAARDLSHWAVDLWHIWQGAWNGMMAGIQRAGANISGQFKIIEGWAVTAWHGIIAAGATLLAWFAALPGNVLASLRSFPGQMFSLGQSLIQGLIGGLQSLAGSLWGAVTGMLGGLVDKAKSLLGIHSPSVVFFRIGVNIGEGLIDGLQSTGTAADNAAKKIAAIILNRILQIRQFALAIMGNMISWASLTSAASGPAFAPTPHWVRGTAVPGGGPTVFSHTGSPAGGGAVAGHWAGGTPVTGGALLRNLNLDLGRLRRFGNIIGRLRRMGLDNRLLQQIIAAGPDQGFQIAEAILDAGQHEIHELNQTEAGIVRASRRIAVTGARSQFGGGGQIVINVRGLLLADRRELARMIQKLLAELKRHNGGQALGLG